MREKEAMEKVRNGIIFYADFSASSEGGSDFCYHAGHSCAVGFEESCSDGDFAAGAANAGVVV